VRKIPKTNRYNQVWGFDGVRMERNQKEVLGVMMKQVGLDRSSIVAVRLLVAAVPAAVLSLKEEEEEERGERPFGIFLRLGLRLLRVRISQDKGFSFLISLKKLSVERL
jgi:hypothetical protein